MSKKLIYLISFVLLLGLVTGAANADITSALVAYYPLDGDVIDATGNGHDGTIMGDPQFVPGKFGQAFEFDGVDDYVQVADYIPISGAGDRSVTAWIKMINTGGSIVSWGVIQAQGKWVIKFSSKGQIRLEIEGDAIKGNTRLADDEWHHVGVSFTNDGTPELGDVDLYADGALQNTQQRSLRIDTSPTGDLEIGRNLKNDGYFQGLIDEVKIFNIGLTADEILQDMEAGPSLLALATKPIPADEATDVPRDVILNWNPLSSADRHDVYLGTQVDDVTVADRSNPLEVLVKQNHDPNTYDPPGLLDFEQTYHWRIDEVNTPDNTIFKGNVWQFTVEPYAYSIAGDLITATASSVDSNDTGAVNTINESGLDDNDEHSSDPSDMWVSNAFDPNQPWIQYELDKVYKLNEMLVWNPAGLGLLNALGIKDALIEYSADGSVWTTLDTVELPQAAQTSVDLHGIAAQTIKITVQSNWSGGVTQQVGLGEVRFLAIPMAARELSPADGTTLADLTAALSWRAGRQAASHDIYLSSDELAVIDGTAPLVNVTESSYTAALDMLDTTYYWKVNEVNEVENPAIWEGDVLSFSTPAYLVVDDFESYDDDYENFNRIFQVWIDGSGYTLPEPGHPGNGSGALVGTDTAPWVEQSNVHGGNQAMPIMYGANGATISEATRFFDPPQDWSKHGLQTLSLYFRGVELNLPGQLYAKINDAQVLYPGDPADLQTGQWFEFLIDLSSLSVTEVTQMTIGVEGGVGTITIDDIRLYLGQ